ncbi:unconventional myosin-VIIa-like [Culicoides brevitarsis]|uniref:unconventional myosin-VIIa-like n=1 Tax=Culicoides brevitarsis TaxID=469753 RepID=UPI00307C3B7B
MLLHNGDWVWIRPEESQNLESTVIFAAQIVHIDKKGLMLVKDDDKKEHWIKQKCVLKPLHQSSLNEVDDMISLGDLSEFSILRNLHLRYQKKKIYTYTSSMLIAINPYEQLPIYSQKYLKLYRNKGIHDEIPHIFAIGNLAYNQMRSSRKNQAIVISGESGAGKTESTKQILQFLASVSGKNSWIEQQVIEANPIMEAFGNAKTVRNDNSSRFGKYIEIYFDTKGAIVGANIDQYLLEKSRIVSQSTNERNYHIFYAMLAGLSVPEKKKLELTIARDYHYLIQNNFSAAADPKNLQEWKKFFNEIKIAMETLNFPSTIVQEIFKILAALLHLGNLTFKDVIIRNNDGVEIGSQEILTRVARFLGLPVDEVEFALTYKTIYVHGEKVIIPLSRDQALEGRDAFVKAIYGKIFLFVIEMINKSTYQELRRIENVQTLGILDIFGFENFETNSFEQLCINYANESLQQFFVRHIFKLEQQEYSSEKISWHHIEFTDNQDILELIGQKSVNIFSLIDEETRFPQGTDKTMLSKLHSTHGTKTLYLKPKYENSNLFGIHHFAGPVFYDSKGFLEKNRDSFSMDLKEVIFLSSNPLLVTLFEADRNIDSNKKSLTLSTQFRNSLDTLLRTLGVCEPLFVRCIKPNEYKANNFFDKELVLKQLRYSGILETAKIRKAGYGIRHFYKDFVGLFSCLLNKSDVKTARGSDRHKLISKAIVDYVFKDKNMQNSVEYGQTKIFLKEFVDSKLMEMREKLYERSAITIQRFYRRILFQKWLKKQRKAAITIQRAWRRHQTIAKITNIQNGIYRLQSLIKSREATRQFRMLRMRLVHFQSHCRGFLTRKNLHKRVAIQENKLKLELIIQRRKDEVDLRERGEGKWREMAQEKYLARLKSLKTKEKRDEESKKMRVEEEIKVVDDEFSFLNGMEKEVFVPQKTEKTFKIENYTHSYKEKAEKDPKSSQKKEKTIKVKKMMTFFEEQSRLVKKIPNKFLSRPVNTYDSSRL